jgi:hypothetical protein
MSTYKNKGKVSPSKGMYGHNLRKNTFDSIKAYDFSTLYTTIPNKKSKSGFKKKDKIDTCFLK